MFSIISHTGVAYGTATSINGRPYRKRGFTMHEIMFVLAISAILLGLVVISSRKAIHARTVDSSSKQFEAAVSLARQLAVSSNGSTLEIIPATGSQPGGWRIQAQDKQDKLGEFPASIVVTATPASPSTITFSSAGTVDCDRTFTLSSTSINKTMTWKLHASTGSLERTNE